ncbi:MAG: response regulator [Planctomycetota bacterium]
MKILIAEDEPVSRRLLQSYLQKWGHEVVLANDGGEAWRLFEQDEFRLVISDWMMPELDGVDLIRRIRATERSGHVYVILLTGRSQKEDVVEGMEAGADDFVTKPFDRDELRVRLRVGERVCELERRLAEQSRELTELREKLAER